MLIQLLVLKGWNTAMQWRMTFSAKNMRVTDRFVRLLLNTIGIYFALESSYAFAAAVYLIMAALYVYLR
ncbi:ABC transporter permease [Bacillus licheniformis]|nr:ABC transporter permease [Bacillus licheniformis]